MSSADRFISPQARPRSVNWSRFARLGAGTVFAAVVANVLVYFIGSAVVGYDPEFIVLADVFGVILFTLLPALGAVLVYGALLRSVDHPARTFTFISAVVFVLSLIPDGAYIPSVPGSSSAQIAILVAMHAVAAGVIVWMLTNSREKR